MRGLGLFLGFFRRSSTTGPGPPAGSGLTLEGGDFLLLESSGFLLLET